MATAAERRNWKTEQVAALIRKMASEGEAAWSMSPGLV